MNTSNGKNKKPMAKDGNNSLRLGWGEIFGGMAWLMALLSLVADTSGLGVYRFWDVFNPFQAAWITCVVLMILFKKDKLLRYWWSFPSLLFAFAFQLLAAFIGVAMSLAGR